MPLEVWVQAVGSGMKIVEVAVPLIYLDESRAFGGALDDADYRLKHYRRVFEGRSSEPACSPRKGVWDDGSPPAGADGRRRRVDRAARVCRRRHHRGQCRSVGSIGTTIFRGEAPECCERRCVRK